MTMRLEIIHRLLMLWILASVMSGCPSPKKSAAPAPAPASDGRVAIRTIKVVITADRRLEVPGLSQAEVEQRVRLHLSQAAAVQLLTAAQVPGEAPEQAYRLLLELAVARAAPGAGLDGPAAVVACNARIPGDVDAVVLQAQAVAALGDKLARANVNKTLSGLLDAVLDDIVFQAGLARASGQELARQLGQLKDLQRLVPAVEIAARRRLPATFKPLLGLLRHSEQEVSDGAVGALVALGDRRAVKPLTRLSHLSDTARLARILDAIASLGGDEAVGYLEFLASGHDDDDIRFMATEALERMKRLEKGSAK